MIARRHKPKFYILLLLLLLAMVFLSSSRPYPVEAQGVSTGSNPIVDQIFAELTPTERVGQLFMVSFNGADVGPGSAVAELIQQYRIGGVILSAKNKNFDNTLSTPAQVLNLTNALQALAQQKPAVFQPPAAAGQPVTGTTALTLPETYTPVPLFVAASHEGDGFPFTDIRGGLTDIPSAMALGATWDPENARQVGQIVGQELSLLGINMLLGPSLDVLDSPRPDRDGSLGTRTFGGNAYWVGEMGQAYIQGVHQGSGYKILTVAKHFPGFGSSDREINQGVPTILKSLDDLRQKELAPFFKVTNLESGQIDGLTDGLMTAHVRYQGLQGNGPISLDARNLPAILALKEIAPWRDAGGFVLSAPLGAPAALEGTSATKENFPARRLAWDALWAGSDVLLLADFAYDNNPADEVANIKSALTFFQEKYASDANFKAAVDKAVRRIIKAKMKIYGDHLLDVQAQGSSDRLSQLFTVASSVDLDKIAQAGVTLITPAARNGLTSLTGPPQPGDDILIFTDDRMVRDCPDCPEFPVIGPTALQELILQLFGPDATGQVSPDNITSLSFTQLKEALIDVPPPSPGQPPAEGGVVTGTVVKPEELAAIKAQTEALIKEAEWVVFVMLNVDTKNYPQSDAVKVLLRSRYDMLRNKNLILFASNAPYFLDETEISQLTAYYALYDKGVNYLEAGARVLFQQFKPAGALPVGIPAVSPLDLSPDPVQIIQLMPLQVTDTRGNTRPLDTQNPVTTLDLAVGEGVLFQTSAIVDRNGHPVPDGTLVNFFRAYPKEGLSLEPLTVKTQKGIAQITILKERETPLQVSASSNLAVQSVPFTIGPGILDTPTPTATFTAVPTGTPSPTATPTMTPVVEVSPTVPLPPPTVPLAPVTERPLLLQPVSLLDLIFAIVGMLLIGGIAFTLGEDRFSLEERIRPALVAVALGLVGYIFYTIIALASPRSGYLGLLVDQGAVGHWVAPLVSLLFAISGMVAWYLKPGRVFWTKAKANRPGPGEDT